MEAATWRYRSGDQEVGPLTTDQLCNLFASGMLSLDTSVYCDAARRWVSARMIPGFRAAASSAPASAQAGATPRSLSFGDEFTDDTKPDVSPESSYSRAAQFSGGVPAIFFLIGLYMTVTGTDPKAARSIPPVISVPLGFCVIAAFFAGIFALFGAGRAHPRKVLVPALFGVIFNGLAILAGVSNFAMTRSTYGRFVGEGITSLINYPGWVGAAKTSGGYVAVASFDDDSPIAHLVNDHLGSRYSVLDIELNNKKGTYAVQVDPSSVVVRTSQGNVRALDLDAALKTSPDSVELLQAWSGRHSVRAGEGHEFLCLLPRGVDLTGAYEVDLTVNGVTTRVPGRFMSTGERKAIYERGRQMQ